MQQSWWRDRVLQEDEQQITKWPQNHKHWNAALKDFSIIKIIYRDFSVCLLPFWHFATPLNVGVLGSLACNYMALFTSSLIKVIRILTAWMSRQSLRVDKVNHLRHEWVLRVDKISDLHVWDDLVQDALAGPRLESDEVVSHDKQRVGR